MQVLSPASSYFYCWMAPGETLKFCRWLNDASAAAVEKDSQRFVGPAAVPMQDSSKVALELEPATTKLDLRGVEIASNISGRCFEDRDFDPFWKAAQALDSLLFVHPSHVLGRGADAKFNLANLIDNPADTSLAFAKLILAAFLSDFPGSVSRSPTAEGSYRKLGGRLDPGYQTQTSSSSKISKPPGEYLRLLYFETIVHSSMALEYLVANFTAEYVVLGSDYPYEMGDPEPLRSVIKIDINIEDKREILGETPAIFCASALRAER